MSIVVKKSTGLKGLAVEKLPHIILNSLYARILRALQDLPVEYPYRQYTEQIVNDRVKILNSTQDAQIVEDKIGCGQIEEVIIQARNELKLAKNMHIWKPWEPLMHEAPSGQWTWPPHK